MKNENDQVGTSKFVGAVENAIRILRCLAEAAEPLGVAAIARDADVNVSTAFNILRTLSKEGVAVFDRRAKTYSLGMGLLEFSVPLLGTNQADLLQPELERLANKHKALIALWKITPTGRIVLVNRVVGENVVRVDMAIGSRLPALAGAVGRCIAASRNLSRKELRRHFAALRWQKAPTFEEYAADVERAAADGYAFDFGQLFLGLDIAASVICDHEGAARFGISGICISGQVTREEIEALAAGIRETARRISHNLYGRALVHVEMGLAACRTAKCQTGERNLEKELAR